MPNDPTIPSNAEDANVFENIFNEAGDQTIGGNQQGEEDPPSAQPQAADFGNPPQGNQEPAQDGQQDGNEAASGQQQSPQDAPTPEDGGQSLQPKDDPERWQYWQSKHDKTAAELEKMKSQMGAYEPILQQLSENPQMAQQLMQGQQEGSSQQQQADPTNVQIEQPERPNKPEKPSDYNVSDALSDPQSDSYKYREKMEHYNEKLAEYNESLVDYNQKREEARKNQLQQQKQRNEQMKEIYNEAVYRHGMQPQQAMKFINWASQPNYTVEDLIAVYKSRNSSETKKNQNAQNLQDRNQRLNTPVPPASQGNEVTHQPETEIDESNPHEMGKAFTDSLFTQLGVDGQ